MFPFYLGIDLHLKRSYLVLMNAEGEVIDKRLCWLHLISDRCRDRFWVIHRRVNWIISARRPLKLEFPKKAALSKPLFH